MELIPINDSKLKIMLDESDMKEYNIGDEADCANSETRQAIRNILDRAKDQIGFDTEGAEIFVQLYTSKRGGCELFVTKSSVCQGIVAPQSEKDKKGKKRSDSSLQRSPERYALPARTGEDKTNKKTDRAKLFYSFDSIESLCKVCKRLSDLSQSLESSAYIGDNDFIYLALKGEGVKEYTRLDKLTFILEFGTREKGYDVSTYLQEHAKPICNSNAIETLGHF